MVVGCLGDFFFEVSHETVMTLSNWKWSGSANYATHKLHGHQALTEFTGLDPDQISFDICLTWALGADPLKTVWELFKAKRNGLAMPLTIGCHPYGNYRWIITSLSNKIEYTDVEGNLYMVTVSLKLQSYLKEVTL